MRRFLLLLLILLGAAACTSPDPTGFPSTGQPVQVPTLTPPPTSATTIASLPVRTIAPTPTQFSPLGVAPAQLRGLTVTFMHPWSGRVAAAALQAAEDFNEQNIWGVRVTVIAPGSPDALDGVVMALLKQKQDLPQVLAAPGQLLAYYARLAGNPFVDLNPFVEDVAWGLDASGQAGFLPAFWNAQEKGVARVMLPLLGDVAFLLYNRSWAQQLGFSSPPQTPAAFRLQACAALRANQATGDPEKLGTGGWLLSRDALALTGWLAGFGHSLQAANEAVRFDTPEAAKAFEYLRRLVDDTCAWSGRNPEPYSYFAGRQALFTSATLLDLVTQQKAMTAHKNGDTWMLLAYPSENGKPGALSAGYSLAVSRNPQGQRASELASWLFVRWLLADRQQAALAGAAELLPSRAATLKMMSQARAQDALWNQAVALLDAARPEPDQAAWRYARLALEDGAWQIFQPFSKAADIPLILQEMDRLTGQLLNRTP